MIFGWDISTSFVGVTVFDDNCKWIKTDHFDFTKLDAESLHDKMDESQWWVEDFLAPYHTGTHHHYFEERLANFSSGRTMLQTLMKLAGFNALFSYEVWRIHKSLVAEGSGVGTTFIHPSTVKAIMKREGLVIPKGGDKKDLTLKFVSKKEPGFVIDRNRNDNPHPWCYDRADSYITGRAGFLRSYLSLNAARTKDPGDAGTPGTRDQEEG